MQSGRESDLTEDEKSAIQHLVLSQVGGANEPVQPRPKKRFKDLLTEARAEQVNARVSKSAYDPAIKAVPGSAAAVEQLWSQASDVLTKKRSTMSSPIFECIMYLKYNRDLWGLADVVEANKSRLGRSKAAQNCTEAQKQKILEFMGEINS